MYILGYDIGGTKCAVSLGSYDGEKMDIVGKEKIPTAGSPYAIIDSLCDAAEKLLKNRSLGFSDVEKCGISCGGPLDSVRGVILSPPNLPGWDNIEIVKYIEEKTGVPGVLENDANACAVAEWKLGAGRGFSNVIFLTFGTGLGAGLILDGRLYSGTNGNAGEVGHIRLSDYGPSGYGKAGSFEGFCSGSGIVQIGKTLALEALQNGIYPGFCKSVDELPAISAKKIADCADLGDAVAKEAYRLSGEKLGYGLSLLVDILNPERIIIGSIFTRSRNLLFDACDAVMKKECLKYSYDVCRVVPAELGENIGDYAALSLALQ